MQDLSQPGAVPADYESGSAVVAHRLGQQVIGLQERLHGIFARYRVSVTIASGNSGQDVARTRHAGLCGASPQLIALDLGEP